jgi:hypothetical protein
MSYKQDDNYIEVAERIEKFYEAYPDGRLVCDDPPIGFKFGEQEFIGVRAKAYRSKEDPYPGDGWAWEPVPGTTPFTRNSELMNAQTAAIGRAIVSVGLLASRKIASAEEVRNRKAESDKPSPPVTATLKGLSDDQVGAVLPAVKAWLQDNAERKDEFKLKLVSLGVESPNKKLSDVLAQLPDEDALKGLMGWLSEHDGIPF